MEAGTYSACHDVNSAACSMANGSSMVTGSSMSTGSNTANGSNMTTGSSMVAGNSNTTGSGCSIEQLVEPMTVYEQMDDGHRIYDNFSGNQSFGGGIVQIFLGILCIICNCTAIIFGDQFSYIGYGIWSGTVFVLSGTFGILAARKRNKNCIIAFLIFCVCSFSLTAALFVFSIANVSLASHLRDCTDCTTTMLHLRVVNISMHCCMMLLAVVQTAVALWGFIICIRTTGCNCRCSFRKTSTDRINLIPGYRHVDLFSSQFHTPPEQNLATWTRIASEGCPIRLESSLHTTQPSGSQNHPESPPPAYKDQALSPINYSDIDSITRSIYHP